MAKDKLSYICSDCSYKTIKWVGKCPNCGSWGTIEDLNRISDKSVSITNIDDIVIDKEFRLKTKFVEFDRVLGGGLTKAEVVLITGAPGIGKSTFLISLLNEYSKKLNTLYISGEESLRQIKERADRLKIKSDNLFLLNETKLENIIGTITEKI